MQKKGILVSLCLLVFLFDSSAQVLKGIVFENEAELPLSYVSIGIINKSGGTYSDEYGKFKFKQADFKSTDSLRFSCIGYKTVTISLDKPIETYADNELRIHMEKETFNLKGVEVFPKSYKTKEIGNKISNQHICICGSNDVEGGIIIRNRKKIYLENLTFRLSAECTQLPDSVLFRINIYNLNNDLPAELLLTQPIYHLLKKDDKTDQISVDIERCNVSVSSDFAAAIEIIKMYGNGKICYAGWISGNPTVFKYGKQAHWAYPTDDKKRRLKIYQSLVIKARVEK